MFQIKLEIQKCFFMDDNQDMKGTFMVTYYFLKWAIKFIVTRKNGNYFNGKSYHNWYHLKYKVERVQTCRSILTAKTVL